MVVNVFAEGGILGGNDDACTRECRFVSVC